MNHGHFEPQNFKYRHKHRYRWGVKSKPTLSISEEGKEKLKKIMLVGNPNVGKSMIFNNLTGIYTNVSNYPGTTVEVFHGIAEIDKERYLVIDTPGMYSLLPITEEERIARNILLTEKPYLVLHIIDAKNIQRMLPLTLQLIEANLPVILVLNMMDELEKLGRKINVDVLEKKLKIPVVGTVATTKKGIDKLKELILNYDKNKISVEFEYDFTFSDSIENGIKEISSFLSEELIFSKRALSIFILLGDKEIMEKYIKDEDKKKEIENIIEKIKGSHKNPLDYIITIERMAIANEIVKYAIEPVKIKKKSFTQFLSDITMHPVIGYIILFFVLYFGVYKVVGEFAAGFLVDFIETNLFEERLNPFFVNLINKILPYKALANLFIGEYGIITLGLRYAFAIIFPIVTVFFLVSAIIEDSGYLPRVAMLLDGFFKKIGLSGRAAIPMILGLGCDTMATIVTRTLPTKRERLLAIVLLSLAIPCSAQLGVILSLFEGKNIPLFIWLGVVFLSFVIVGYIGNKILPGNKPVFYIEVPPLRLPSLVNVVSKTASRVHWYLKEVIPLFILTSVIIWLGQITGGLDIVTRILKYPLMIIDLPESAAKIFLFGFLRRDYGAAGLYDLVKVGEIDTIQLTVAAVILTLFLPCIAQFIVTIKERGIKTAFAIFIFILFYSFGIGIIVNMILRHSGIIGIIK